MKIPGVSYNYRKDETDHCFPSDASHHYVCCVDIKNPENQNFKINEHDIVRNPLEEQIKRNSHPSSYSWCTCNERICIEQLKGRVEWTGVPPGTLNNKYDEL